MRELHAPLYGEGNCCPGDYGDIILTVAMGGLTCDNRAGAQRVAAMAQRGMGDVQREMLDDIVAEDADNAARRHRSGPGQVEIHIRPPDDVGVDPPVQAHGARADVHQNRGWHRRNRPLESPRQQWGTYRDQRVIDNRARGFPMPVRIPGLLLTGTWHCQSRPRLIMRMATRPQ